MFVSNRFYNIFSCSINKGTDMTDLSHSELSLLQPLHIVEDESTTLFFFTVPFQACTKEVLHKFFKRLQWKGWGKERYCHPLYFKFDVAKKISANGQVLYMQLLLKRQTEEAGKKNLL